VNVQGSFGELLEGFADAWAHGNDTRALALARLADDVLPPWACELPLTTPWPSIEEYILAHDCPRCGAPVGVECRVRRGRLRFHAPRSDCGLRRYRRDIVRAPWREDRVPGRRYDSLKRNA
jgi:hypothetical protein